MQYKHLSDAWSLLESAGKASQPRRRSTRKTVVPLAMPEAKKPKTLVSSAIPEEIKHLYLRDYLQQHVKQHLKEPVRLMLRDIFPESVLLGLGQRATEEKKLWGELLDNEDRKVERVRRKAK